MTASAGRRAALAVVSRVRERNAFAHETLDAFLRGHKALDARDAALATRLSYGVISCRGTLDEALDRYLDHPGRVEPRVRDALAIGAWELLFGDVQPRVAVSETVELVRSVRPQASTLANAVMRRLAEGTESFPWGDPTGDDVALARLFGHPMWMAQRLITDLGRDTAAEVMAADNEPAPLYVAALPFERSFSETIQRLAGGGAQPTVGPVPGSIELGRAASVATGEREWDGFIVSDAAAQFAVSTVRARPGMRIVEIGAGRGTKSLLLQANAMRAGGFAEVWAVDSHAFKLSVLSRILDRNHLRDFIHLIVADATDLSACESLPESGTVDAVLVDAPCSGLGTLRRHPDKRWRIRPEDIDTMAALGSRLLSEASSLVRRGGFVVYSTCTLTRQENDHVIRGFLGGPQGREFTVDHLTPEVPPEWAQFVAQEGWFQSVPRKGGPDGHFVARLKRV